jgi:hypothetical protein
MDGAGVSTFLTALQSAEQQGAFELEHDGTTHRLVIEAGAADIELGSNSVVWRLDRAKAAEIAEDLTELNSSDGPGHDYVDISTPTSTLVLSRDEYISA